MKRKSLITLGIIFSIPIVLLALFFILFYLTPECKMVSSDVQVCGSSIEFLNKIAFFVDKFVR